MRDRYRAWHKEEKKMYEVSALYRHGGVRLYDGVTDKPCPGDNIFLMQCTGVRDMYGDWIYDGDIVVNQDPKFNKRYKDSIVVVSFYRGAFVMQDPETNVLDDFINYADAYKQCIFIKILGNFYEHPELLN